jgi:hypothetical protein
MDSSQTNVNIEAVEIEEPSDRVQVLSDEKTCITRKHLYIIVGVLLVAAIALIGTLLGFSPSSSDQGLTPAAMATGVGNTFPMFDTNNDGKIDMNELSNWMTVQMAGCQGDCNGVANCPHSCGVPCVNAGEGTSNCTGPAHAAVQEHLSKNDLNGNGVLEQHELVTGTLNAAAHGGNANGGQSLPAAPSLQKNCPHPHGVRGEHHGKHFGGCDRKSDLWCFKYWGCQDKHHCPKSYLGDTAQNAGVLSSTNCCVDASGPSCNTTTTVCPSGDPTTGDCPAVTYSFIDIADAGSIAAGCAKFATFWCGDEDTGVHVGA